MVTSTDWCSKGLGSSQGPPSSLQVNCHPDMSGLIVDRQAADSLAHRAPSEPAPMVRQSLGSPSPQETGPACTGAPFTHTHTQTHTSGLRAPGGSGGGLELELVKGGPRSCSSAVPSGTKLQLSWGQGPGPGQQVSPAAPRSGPRGVLPSGRSSAVTFLPVRGRLDRGCSLAGRAQHPQDSSAVGLVSFFILQPSRHL